MRTLVGTAAFLATLGCAPAPPQNASSLPASSCNAEKAQSFIGQPASADLAQQAQALSGAGIVRWLQPGQVVTMEYRAERLNIDLDRQNRVIAIRCG